MLVLDKLRLSLACTVGLVCVIHLSRALPLVDSGLFVILGVSTCRDGAGYCLLGSDCTLDHDFSPDDTGGHCNGLRTAFTPSANFVCCKYNGADVKMPSTTTEVPLKSSTESTPIKSTAAVDNKPSKRPAISDGATKPQAPVSDSTNPGGAIFWVDLTANGDKTSNPNRVKYEPVKNTVNDANTRPGSIITVSGASPALVQNVPVSNVPSIENWIKPGALMDIPSIVAAKPGSTVTVGGNNELLDEIVHAVGSEVSQGVSIVTQDLSQQIVSPSLQLDTVDEPEEEEEKPAVPVGSIESHEPKPTIEVLRPQASVITTSSTASTPVVASKKPSAQVASTTAKPADEDDDDGADEEEDDDEEATSEEEEDSEEEDDGLFGFSDLVELFGLGTAQKAGAAKVDGSKNETDDDAESKLGEDNVLQERIDQIEPNQVEAENASIASNLVGGFLSSAQDSTVNPSNLETSTLPLDGLFSSGSSEAAPSAKEEEPPLCFGPVRQPSDPACWVVTFQTDKNGVPTTLCSGARITKDLVVTSASCAIRISSLSTSPLASIIAVLPASGEAESKIAISDVVVHENYHAAPRLALNDIGLVKLNTSFTDISELDMGHCTLCLSQDTESDFSHLNCQTPQFFGDNESESPLTIRLTEVSTLSRNMCDTLVKSGAAESDDLPTMLCSAPAKSQIENLHHVDGIPLVCSGTRGIPFLAGVTMKSSIADWTIYSPVSQYLDWIRANELPQIIKTVTTKTLST